MAEFPKTKQNRIKRKPERGQYDKETIYAILDEALIGYVAFAEGDQPFVIPTNYGREGDILFLHGAKNSRLMKHIQAGHSLSISTAIVDGIVFARSVFHHSMNYRSVTLFGRGRLLETSAEKMHALEVITEHIAPGRWADARQPNSKELAATSVVAVPVESAAAKIRSGPVSDDEEDYSLPVWAGVVPLEIIAGKPVEDLRLAEEVTLPPYLRPYRRIKL